MARLFVILYSLFIEPHPKSTRFAARCGVSGGVCSYPPCKPELIEPVIILYLIPRYFDVPVWYILFIGVSTIIRLKELRRSKRISQMKMSIDMNIAQNTLSQYETGVREPDLNTLKRLADYFDVSVDYLLERTDNPRINK